MELECVAVDATGALGAPAQGSLAGGPFRAARVDARSGVPTRVRKPRLDEGPFAATRVGGRAEGDQSRGNSDRRPAEDADEAVFDQPLACWRAEGSTQGCGIIALSIPEGAEAGPLPGRDEELTVGSLGFGF